MKNKPQSKLLPYLEKLYALQDKIREAINKEEIDKVIELVENRGRLLLLIERLASKEIKIDLRIQELIDKLYKNSQDFNHEINSKLTVLSDSITQQIAQTYKNKVSLRGYKSTSSGR